MDILIEELDGGLWTAAVDRRRLQGLEVDPGQEGVRWGSIYYGRIIKIDKALDAVFVDLDGTHTGILHNPDVRIFDPKTGILLSGGKMGISKRLRAGEMIPVQAKSGFTAANPSLPPDPENKLPKLSMDITLPGRYLVHAPYMCENQISSRVRNKFLREQMTKMLSIFTPAQGMILRSSAADMQTDILLREARILKTIWEQIQPFFAGDTPILVMDGPDSFQRTIGDQSSARIDRIQVTTMDHYQQIEEWCELFAPDLVTKITPVELEDPHAELALFDHRGILKDIEILFSREIPLSSGGNLILDTTAAMTILDVNRGHDNRSIMEINLDAAHEIARQIRLRNIGGIIVVDFLKFSKQDDRKTFLASLPPLFDKDSCTVQIHGLTKLGLLEMTRKRRTPSLMEQLEHIEGLNADE